MRATRTGQGMVTGLNPAPRAFLYTPTVVWGANTIAGSTGAYIKVAGELHLWISFQETAGAASAVMTVSLPTGYTAITLAGSLVAGVGSFGTSTLATFLPMGVAAGASTQITSVQAQTGQVTTWFGMFIVPTLT